MAMTARWVFLGYLNVVLHVRGERYMRCTLSISFETGSVAGVIVWGSPNPVIGQRLDWTPSTRELTL